mmetsp:Transcript_33154/g.95317  ORF Transcript_33154/g.95317 Transcript_33154/m.95317 type:complete len:244 (+) Transcript_33154:541-1272(+)
MVARLCTACLAAEHFHRSINLCQLLPMLILSFKVRRHSGDCRGPRYRHCKAVQLPLRRLELAELLRVLLCQSGNLGFWLSGLLSGQESHADGLHIFAGGRATPVPLVVGCSLSQLVGPDCAAHACTTHGPQLNERSSLLDGVVECLLCGIQVSGGRIHGLQMALNTGNLDHHLLILHILGSESLALVPGQAAIGAPLRSLGLSAGGPGGLPGEQRGWRRWAAGWLLRGGWRGATSAGCRSRAS